MEAIPRAAPRARTNRERPLVTRHGLRSLHAATSSLRPMSQCTPLAKIRAAGLDISHHQAPIRGQSAKNLTREIPADLTAAPAMPSPRPGKT